MGKSSELIQSQTFVFTLDSHLIFRFPQPKGKGLKLGVKGMMSSGVGGVNVLAYISNLSFTQSLKLLKKSVVVGGGD